MTNLETIRRNRNLQQQELADLAKVPQATISRVESGKGTTLKSALKIARALTLTIEEVFGDMALDDGNTPVPGTLDAVSAAPPAPPAPPAQPPADDALARNKALVVQAMLTRKAERDAAEAARKRVA